MTTGKGTDPATGRQHQFMTGLLDELWTDWEALRERWRYLGNVLPYWCQSREELRNHIHNVVLGTTPRILTKRDAGRVISYLKKKRRLLKQTRRMLQV